MNQIDLGMNVAPTSRIALLSSKMHDVTHIPLYIFIYRETASNTRFVLQRFTRDQVERDWRDEVWKIQAR